MFFLFFKQKTAYEMRISDWSSDVFSSDLVHARLRTPAPGAMLYCQEFPTRTNLVFSVAQSSSSRFVSIGSRRTRRSTRRGFAARVSFCVGLLDSARLLATVKRKQIGRAHV